MGIVGSDTAPASTIRSAHTVAKMGRRIKNSTTKLYLSFVAASLLMQNSSPPQFPLLLKDPAGSPALHPWVYVPSPLLCIWASAPEAASNPRPSPAPALAAVASAEPGRPPGVIECPTESHGRPPSTPPALDTHCRPALPPPPPPHQRRIRTTSPRRRAQTHH